MQIINSRLLAIVEEILQESDSQPIIVFQGDTGGPDQTKFIILNVYYLMGEIPPDLYYEITPVNTFRLIFDRYFGSEYGLLPDATYDKDVELMPENNPAYLR